MATRKIHGNWYVDFRYNHKRHRIRSNANTKAGTKRYEAKLIANLMANKPIAQPEVERPIFESFAWHWFEVYVKNNNKHSEVVTKESILRTSLIPYFGSMELAKINSYAVEDFKLSRAKQGKCAKTINNHLTVLRKCLNTAQEWGKLELTPKIKLLRVEEKELTYMTDGECTALLANSTGVLHDMIFFALRTGLRFGELIALDWKNVDLKNRQLTISRSVAKQVEGSTKSNKIRYVPISNDLHSMLSMATDQEGYVFKNDLGNRIGQFNSLRALKRACKRAKVRKIGWHCFRHTFASRLVQKNISMKTIQTLLGHSDMKTTMRYAHLSPDNMKQAVNLLDDPKDFGHSVGTTFIIPIKDPSAAGDAPANITLR